MGAGGQAIEVVKHRILDRDSQWNTASIQYSQWLEKRYCPSYFAKCGPCSLSPLSILRCCYPFEFLRSRTLCYTSHLALGISTDAPKFFFCCAFVLVRLAKARILFWELRGEFYNLDQGIHDCCCLETFKAHLSPSTHGRFLELLYLCFSPWC